VIPVQGKALDREFDIDAVIEAEERQEKHWYIEKDQKYDRIDLKRPVGAIDIGG
jgi:hypothetical protein